MTLRGLYHQQVKTEPKTYQTMFTFNTCHGTTARSTNLHSHGFGRGSDPREEPGHKSQPAACGRGGEVWLWKLKLKGIEALEELKLRISNTVL